MSLFKAMDGQAYVPEKLPEIQRSAMWHAEAGLIVSPFTRTLPKTIDVSDAPSTHRHYDEPHLLEDFEIYLAFSPKRPIHSGPIFSTLALSPSEISKAVVRLKKPAGSSYALEPKLMKAWALLEDSLYQIITALMEHHPKRRNLPRIVWPRWPWQHGYRDSYDSYDFAYASVKRSIAAFSTMSTCATFVLALWLGPFEDDCFDAAFSMLSNLPKNSLPPQWLQLLRESIVCNLSPGLRAGAFLNPYKTEWGAFMAYFCRASTPIWFIWGERYNDAAPVQPEMAKVYLPPPEYIDYAISRANTYSSLILPYQKTDSFGKTPPPPRYAIDLSDDSVETTVRRRPEAIDLSDDSPPPEWTAGPAPVCDRSKIVNADSGQRSGETWEEFKIRMELGLENRKKRETPAEKKAREARETHALEKGPAAKASVYTWERDEVNSSVYRRTRVEHEEKQQEYHGTHEYGRFFWSHLNEWDLVHHLPPPLGVEKPEAYPNPFDNDDDLDFEGISGRASYTPDPSLAQGLLDAVAAVAVYKDPAEEKYEFRFDSLKAYLKDRHGYRVGTAGETWNPVKHSNNPGGICIERKSYTTAIKILLYDNARLSEKEFESVVDCYNAVVNPDTAWDLLPKPFDISSESVAAPAFVVDMTKLAMSRVESEASVSYVLRPVAGSSDPTPWFIVVSSATAVLEVYRKEWYTMVEIAREFLARGIPFRTVVARDEPPLEPPTSKTKGLGYRPKGYEFTDLDYSMYKRARAKVFSSPRGRVLRMLGGVVGRLASEVVPDSSVLDGPSICDQVVLKLGTQYLLDDGISEQALDVVNGVFRVLRGLGSGSTLAVKHMSYWPKHSAWKGSGKMGDQWSPAAEAFFQDQMSRLEAGPRLMKGHNEWVEKLRGYHKKTTTFFSASDRLADKFIRESPRVR